MARKKFNLNKYKADRAKHAKNNRECDEFFGLVKAPAPKKEKKQTMADVNRMIREAGL